MKLWEDTPSALAAIKAAGFQVVVTHLSQTSVPVKVPPASSLEMHTADAIHINTRVLALPSCHLPHHHSTTTTNNFNTTRLCRKRPPPPPPPPPLPLQAIDWSKPTAVILGNEHYGVSAEAVALADHCAVIPMTGFAESFNISVAAALVLYTAREQRIAALGRHGDLTDQQKEIMRAAFMLKAVVSVAHARSACLNPKNPTR